MERCEICGDCAMDGDPLVEYTGMFEPGVSHYAHIECAISERWEEGWPKEQMWRVTWTQPESGRPQWLDVRGGNPEEHLQTVRERMGAEDVKVVSL